MGGKSGELYEVLLKYTYDDKGDIDLPQALHEAFLVGKTSRVESMGLLGRLWGSDAHAAKNIAGVIAFIAVLVLLGFVAAYWVNQNSPIKEFIGIIVGLITTCLAYLFGREGGKSK